MHVVYTPTTNYGVNLLTVSTWYSTNISAGIVWDMHVTLPTVTLAVPYCDPLAVRNEDVELTVAVQV